MKSEKVGQIVGEILVPFIAAAILMWFDYLFFGVNPPFLALVAAGILVLFINTFSVFKVLQEIWLFLLVAALLTQIFVWFRIAKAPIFKKEVVVKENVITIEK